MSLPSALAFDSANNLYVANDGNNDIEEFNSSGVGSLFPSSGLLDNPTGLAFEETIPEPSTWALVAVALIELLPLRRRRASSSSAYR